MKKGLRVGPGIGRDDVAVTDELVLVNQQTFDADRFAEALVPVSE